MVRKSKNQKKPKNPKKSIKKTKFYQKTSKNIKKHQKKQKKMSNILEKIAELTEKRDVEISINIKLGQDVVKTTSDALAVMANELVNVMDILENKTKNHAKEAIFNATKENKDS